MINYTENISKSGNTIYDIIDPEDKSLFIPLDELQRLLSDALVGISLEGLPLKTRSKVVKQEICKALGYPVPSTFTKTRPRFPGQNFDVYIQKSMNVQIWNERVDEKRRYVFLKVDLSDIIIRVKVITGGFFDD